MEKSGLNDAIDSIFGVEPEIPTPAETDNSEGTADGE
jgi:hypothetical protein